MSGLLAEALAQAGAREARPTPSRVVRMGSVRATMIFIVMKKLTIEVYFRGNNMLGYRLYP